MRISKLSEDLQQRILEYVDLTPSIPHWREGVEQMQQNDRLGLVAKRPGGKIRLAWYLLFDFSFGGTPDSAGYLTLRRIRTWSYILSWSQKNDEY
jgi:hypothetical protein